MLFSLYIIMDVDRSSVDCGVCLNMLTNPVSLPCGHNLCMECLLDLQRKALFQTLCPLCSRRVPLISFKTNLILDQLLSTFYPEEACARRPYERSLIQPSWLQRLLHISLKCGKLLGGISLGVLTLLVLARAAERRWGVDVVARVKWLLRLSRASMLWQLVWTVGLFLVRYIEASSILSSLSM